MFNRKSLIMIVTILVLLTAIPLVAMESGSAKFVVARTLFVAGTEVKAGVYDVKWQAEDQQAEVTFAPVGKPGGITVKGTLEEVDKKYNLNSVAIGTDAFGREAILQLQFAGKKVRINFD